MKAVKIIGYVSASFALLCMTGFDCPECNYVAQGIALGASALIAIVCGLIVANHQQRKGEL